MIVGPVAVAFSFIQVDELPPNLLVARADRGGVLQEARSLVVMPELHLTARQHAPVEGLAPQRRVLAQQLGLGGDAPGAVLDRGEEEQHVATVVAGEVRVLEGGLAEWA